MVSGVNSDEASIGYDAWAIANYGIDRNLTWMPAYLIAWGSGQNAGYAYLIMPFIQILGLSVFSVRLPMALVGCVSMWALYTILRRHPDKYLPLVGLFLLAICPWHVLKSRWALESNLFPDMLLWGTALICAGLAGGKKRFFIGGFFIWGLSTWAYATSFIMLPIFVLPVAWVLWRKKHLRLGELVACGLAFLAASWPIILFTLVTAFGWPAIELPFLTIPQLVASRQGEFALLGENPIGQILRNTKSIISILLSQDDGMSWSVVPGFGLIYLFSLPLAAAGFFRSVLPRDKGGKYWDLVPGSWLFLPWLVAAVFISVTIPPNVNRANALWFPLVWYWIVGAYEVVSSGLFWRRFLAGTYAVFFLLFCSTTLKVQNDRFNVAFDGGFIQAVQYVDAMDKPVYVSGASPAYIKVLFAVQPPPQDFRDSVTQEDIGAFGNVYQWDKWTVAEPPPPQPSTDYVLVVREGKEGPYLEAGWNLVQFEHFWAGQYGN